MSELGTPTSSDSNPRAVEFATTGLPALNNAIDDAPVSLAEYDDRARGRISQIVAATPRLDGRAVNAFAAEPQTKANAFLDELLSGIKTSSVGQSGALVAQLATGVQMLDIPGMRAEAEGKKPAGFLASIPVFGAALEQRYSAFQRFRNNQQQIIAHFKAIDENGRRDMATLAAFDSRLDRLVDQNLDSIRELGLWEVAGRVILRREKDRYRTNREQALAKQDVVLLTRVRDDGEQINAFETRLMRLGMAIQDAMTNVPTTRLTQSAGRIEYQNILDTLLFDLPRLKNAIVRVASLKAINDASAATNARREMARQTQAAGIEMLDKAYTKAKESQGGALAEIAAMGEIADRIVGIIDKGSQIDARNRESRDEAMRRLQEVKQKFVTGLVESTASAVRSNI